MCQSIELNDYCYGTMLHNTVNSHSNSRRFWLVRQVQQQTVSEVGGTLNEEKWSKEARIEVRGRGSVILQKQSGKCINWKQVGGFNRDFFTDDFSVVIKDAKYYYFVERLCIKMIFTTTDIIKHRILRKVRQWITFQKDTMSEKVVKAWSIQYKYFRTVQMIYSRTLYIEYSCGACPFYFMYRLADVYCFFLWYSITFYYVYTSFHHFKDLKMPEHTVYCN